MQDLTKLSDDELLDNLLDIEEDYNKAIRNENAIGFYTLLDLKNSYKNELKRRLARVRELEEIVRPKTSKISLDEQDLKKEIDNMRHEQMASLWRFAPSDSPYFQGEIGDYFKKVFKEKGGMTIEISKRIGWNY